MVVVWGADLCDHRRHHCLLEHHAELRLQFFHLILRFLRFLSVSSHFCLHEGDQGLCVCRTLWGWWDERLIAAAVVANTIGHRRFA